VIEITNKENKVIYVSKNAENIREAVEEAVRRGVSLENANFAGKDLSYLEARGGVFSGACFESAILDYAELETITACSADFRRASFIKTRIEASILTNCTFAHSKWDSCWINSSEFFDSDFTEVHMSEITAHSTKLDGCRFDGAVVKWSDFSLSTLDKALCTKGKFLGVKFIATNFTGAVFQLVEIVGTNMRQSDFTNSVFKDCFLLGVTLNESSFKNTSFEGSSLHEVELLRIISEGVVNTKGVDFTASIFDKQTLVALEFKDCPFGAILE
jgi:uncharacterized protein YjbI with pentapeptide repeats